MSHKHGSLFVVATPIGNLQDITLRALEILKTVDLIAAEDTRHTQKLLQHFAIQKPLISLHEYNETQKIKHILALLTEGKKIALVADAGTPLISDPGFHLVAALQAAHIKVIPIPGACAAICALSVSGLPTDRFVFEGFLSAKKSAALEKLKILSTEPRTLIFYEAPHRIEKTLELMIEVFGGERDACLARELTKLFETIRKDNLINLQNWLKENAEQRQGEFVILVSGVKENKVVGAEIDLNHLLSILLSELSVKQAVEIATKVTNQKKNKIYQLALDYKRLLSRSTRG